MFIAVELPDEVRASVAALTTTLAAKEWPIRWVAGEAAHITLHFLGEIEPQRAELVRLALGAVVARHITFDLRTAGIGVFPNLRRPRVVWLGLHGPTHRLEALQRDLGEKLQSLDFPVEAGPYHAHITLGRVREHGSPEFHLRDLPEALRPYLADAGTGEMTPPKYRVEVSAVSLVRSHLERNGPRYETIARYPLAAATEEPR
jgi:2'-5' RNA ligase